MTSQSTLLAPPTSRAATTSGPERDEDPAEGGDSGVQPGPHERTGRGLPDDRGGWDSAMIDYVDTLYAAVDPTAPVATAAIPCP